ncbi:mannan chain length control protein LmeA [Mycolicibacterium confluentis]|uniref:mannan chain length control protein LmeA n=1 Tax=Mycolicibacterium confluentis TaxID=28047 RepID=UPI000A161998|nr:mannan chain length control protein LmeA [Mycolicibacterium confluentis]MCV7322545.1 mannan chain length control protein LmeA [Mycolicibacterium confluentis]ORV21395.1 hypothetical protein AWB99_26495 [Mycolicibacterium confluentis]
MRRFVTRSAVAVLTVVLAAIAVDFGAAILAEYRLSRAVRNAAHLQWDPSVAILGFPFSPQAMRHHYDEVEIKANDVEHRHVGRASLEATMHSVGLTDASWLVRPEAPLPIGKIESRIIIDSAHLGAFMGLKDLMVEAPTRESNDATGGTTESGISGSQGLVFTATPKSAGLEERVSVSVDLSIEGPERTTLVFTPTEVLTGPGTADQEVPEENRDAVLAAFAARLPDQRLPFGVAPTSQGARGSDVIIEGITEGLTITLAEFTQS